MLHTAGDILCLLLVPSFLLEFLHSMCVSLFSETKEKEYSLQFSGILKLIAMVWAWCAFPFTQKAQDLKAWFPVGGAISGNFRRWSLTEEASCQGCVLKGCMCFRYFSVDHELSNLLHAPTAMFHHGHRINRAKDYRLKSLKPSQDK